MKVSVLVNNFNYSEYIDYCIESLFNQTYKDIEIIVYDDGSWDSSLNKLSKYQGRVKVISNENYGHNPNENQANAIYQAFIRSTGEIICLLDSDDAFYDEKVNRVVSVFKENPQITTVQNLLNEMDSKDNILGEIRPVIKNVGNIKKYIFEHHNFFHLFVATSGLSFRRDFLEEVLPLMEDGLSYVWPDARLSILSALKGHIQTIMEPLSYYRIHSVNDSNARSTNFGHSQYLKQIYRYFNKVAIENNFPCIEYKLESYLENTFFYMNLNKEGILTFCERCYDSEIWLWGAGEAGQSILHLLNKNGVKVFGFIDVNPKRDNEQIMGLTVSKVPKYLNKKYIISPFHAYNDIKILLEEKGLKENIDFINPYIR